MATAPRKTLREDFRSVADLAADFYESLPSRTVGSPVSPDQILSLVDRKLADDGLPPRQVIEELARDVDQGLTASAGPRYFGFVVGGSTPASLMADWLTSTWDQNAQVHATSPAASAVETVVSRWLIDLLGLPTESSLGFVTGCQMANFTALLSGRNALFESAGWDVQTNGLFDAPPVKVMLCECAHATVRSALQMMGIGTNQICEIASDTQGRMRLDALEPEIRRASGEPMLLSLQAGNVNTGAFEPIEEIASLVESENAWIHVDGAFGLWAAASPKLKGHVRGLSRADSWATDAHKWLNVPYDSGIVAVKNPSHHRSIKTGRCSYAGAETEGVRDGSSWTPENSRRARAFVLYALLRELGRTGVVSLVERCCDLARITAEQLSEVPGARILNEVALNQVLFRIETTSGDDDDRLQQDIAERVQKEGTCWLGTTTWKGRPALRISICSWQTTESDVAILVDSLAQAARGANGS